MQGKEAPAARKEKKRKETGENKVQCREKGVKMGFSSVERKKSENREKKQYPMQ